MAFGDFGRHGTNPNPLRTFALTKHSPLIGRDASQPGQWANFDYYHQKSPKRVDNPGGHAPHRGPPNGPFGPTLFSPPKLVDNPGGGGGSIYIYKYKYKYKYVYIQKDTNIRTDRQTQTNGSELRALCPKRLHQRIRHGKFNASDVGAWVPIRIGPSLGTHSDARSLHFASRNGSITQLEGSRQGALILRISRTVQTKGMHVCKGARVQFFVTFVLFCCKRFWLWALAGKREFPILPWKA